MANAAGAPRRIFRRSAEPLASDVSLIASEFLAGFQLVEKIDRPAVSIFGSARIAEGADCVRMEWAVLDWNERALAFYRRLGARQHREWLRFSLEPAEIRAHVDQ